MTINSIQLKEIIIKPALNAIGLCSDSSINLLLGTAAQETNLGRYLVQTNIDPYLGGIGLYQMEAKTYEYIWEKHVNRSIHMRAKVRLYLGYEGRPMAARMASDMGLATIMARLNYANVLERLPDAKDVKALARYWKIYWNTMAGKGTEDQFIDHYKEFID